MKSLLLQRVFLPCAFCLVSALVHPLFSKTRLVTLPLEIESGEGCIFDARSARLLDRAPVQDPQGRIAVEAEDAARYFLSPSRWRRSAPLPSDPAASGQYLVDVIYARYDFLIEMPGKFEAWVRVSTPKGRSRFRNLIDGRWYMAPFSEDNKEDAKPFYWVKRGTLALGRGWHTYELVKHANAFPKIDRLVFQPEGLPPPEGKGPPGAGQTTVSGRVTTSRLILPGLVELSQLKGLSGNGLAVTVSLDDGKTWTPWVPGLKVDASSQVRFRFDLQQEPGAAAPELKGLGLRARVDSSRWLELRNRVSRLVFDPGTGGLILAECFRTGDVVCLPGRPRPLAAVIFKKAGEADRLRVTPETRTILKSVPGRRKGVWSLKPQAPEEHPVIPVKVKARGKELEVEYLFEAPSWGRAALSYRIRPASREAWDFEVTVRNLEGPADVVGVVFPIWEHVRIGPSGLDDHQLRLQSFGHHTWHPGNRTIRDERYFGSVVMPWTEVHDERTGLYVGAHDASATNVLFESRPEAPAAEHFAMSTTKLHNIHPGERRSYSYAVAVHPGDWHQGADLYRQWFQKTFGQAHYPGWLRETRGWVALQAENYGRSFRFSRIPQYLTNARAVGVDWVQVWGQFAYDGGPCCSAIYPPSPLYGGEEEWAEAVRAVTARGGHVGGYFVNDRIDFLPLALKTFLGHFDLDEYPKNSPWPSPDFLDQVRLITDPAGTLPPFPPSAEQVEAFRKKVEKHGKVYREGKRALPVQWWVKTYLNDPVWWDFLKFWIVDKYEKEYGCNTAYIDVLGTGACQESYDPRRNHNGDGGHTRGKWQMARHIVLAAQKVNPDFAVTQEGLGDLTGLYCAPMASGIYRGGRNIYRYTFPDRILIHGVTNPGSGGSAMDRYLETFLEGMRFDIVGRTNALALYLMHLHEQFLPALYHARFLDTVGLEVSSPRIRARRYRVTESSLDGALLTLVNQDRMAGERIQLKTEEVGEIRSAFFVQDDGRAGTLELHREPGLVEFKAPRALASMVWVGAKVPVGSVPWPVFHLQRSGQPAARVTLLNSGPKSSSGVCRLSVLGLTEPFDKDPGRGADALPLLRKEMAFSVGPGQSSSLDFPLRTLKNHRWTVRLAVTVTVSNGRSLTREFLATPYVLDSSWELAGTPDERAAHGEKSRYLGPTQSGYQHDLLDLWLEPSRRYRLTLKARRTGFTAAVQGTLLMVQTPSNPRAVWQHRSLDRSRPDQWQVISYEFDTPADMTRCGLYLYNVRSPDKAWFDDLLVEDLGPARARTAPQQGE